MPGTGADKIRANPRDTLPRPDNGGAVDLQAHQFDRFRRHGDLEALGAVFDATAPKLLRIALHVSGDAHDADDLLQQTFLVAIQRAEEFDATQPFEAWLVGILRHLTSNLLRRRGRRASREQALPDSVSAVQQRTPEAASESVELRELLRRHIDELPAEQRQVLLLQMEHGLGPAEIARVLEVSPGSVRMRLQRGRDALRRLLPAGIASAAVFGAGRSSLAAVRAKTLAAGAAVRPVASGLAVGGSVVGVLAVAMKHWILAGGAVLALVFAGVWVGMRGSDGARPDSVVAESDPRSSTSGDVGPAVPESAARVPVDEPSGTDRPSDEVAPTQAVVRGRVVGEDGVALLGVRVELTAHWRDTRERDFYRLEHGGEDWSAPAIVETTSDGRFAFRFELPELRSVSCSFEGSELVPVERESLPLETGRTLDLGDVTMLRGVTWSGRVVDANGLPQARQFLSLEREGARIAGQDSRVTVHAESDGSFATRRPVLPGSYTLSAGGREIVRPEGAVQLDVGSGPVEIVLAPQAPDTRARIRGRVVDEDGRGIYWADVYSEQVGPYGAGSSERLQAVTDPRGHFELVRPVAFEHETAATVSVFEEGYALWGSDTPVTWGSDDVEVRLERGPALEVRVTAADGSGPVERFGITLEPQRAGRFSTSSDDRTVRHLGDHPGGLLRIPHVTPATYRVDVVSAVGRSESGPQEIEIVAGRTGAVDFVVHPEVECLVEVVDALGESVRDVPVELVRHQGGGTLTLRMIVLDADVAVINGDHVASREGSWRTAADGRVSIRYAPGPGVGLRLPGPGNVPCLVQPLPFDSAEPIRVVVERGAVLTGEIGPAEFREWVLGLPRDDPSAQMRMCLWLEGLDGRQGETVPPQVGMEFGSPVDEDGRFEVRGVPPGAWAVRLNWGETWTDERGRIRPGQMQSRPVVDRVEVVEGGEIHLPIDLSAHVPSRVRFDATVDGLSRRVELMLTQIVGRSSYGHEVTMNLRRTTDPDGSLELDLPLGSWTVDSFCTESNARIPLGSRSIEVVPSTGGSPQRIPLDLAIGRAAIRLFQPDGSPAAGVEVLLQPPGSEFVFGLGSPVTDSEGRASIVAYPTVAQVRALRRPFVDRKVYREWCDRHPDAHVLAHLIHLGEMTLVRGEPEEIELHLPDAWARLPD